ncbi:MAG TPA: hypothetical protein VFZ77_02990 [Acidimicrobiales bacterium]
MPEQQIAHLPYLDEHVTAVAAGPDAAWRAVVDAVDASFSRTGAGWYARAVGCADTAATGPRPLAEGSTIPGFRVAAAVPGRELVLRGRHRFSDYALVFRVEPAGPDRTLVRAESRAAFPGLPGAAYRALVFGTRAHVRGIRSLLAGVRRRAGAATGG